MAIRPTLNIAVAKKKNKASEYNENFELMMDFIDSSIGEAKDYVDGYMPAVSASTATKFLTNNGSATSWQGLGNGFPFSDIINGLIVTKSSNDTVAVSAGSCYDSTGAVILALNASTTKQNESQTASTTYYVYIIGNGTNVDLLIDGDTPTLPTGYTYYRLLGMYTTDSDGNINAVFGNANYSGDGQWVEAFAELSTSSSTGTYNIDLSSYLPSDNYAYEVLVGCEMYTDGINKLQSLSSSIITTFVNVNHTEGYADGSVGTCIIPVGADRMLYYKISNNGGGTCRLKLNAYRRIGTNS